MPTSRTERSARTLLPAACFRCSRGRNTSTSSPQETLIAAAEVEQIIPTVAGQGVTVVLIEHNMEFVRRICDCVYALAAGTIIAHGQVDAVLSDPVVIEAYLGPPTEQTDTAGVAPHQRPAKPIEPVV
jgi:ABC-type methionine transport system ATPase subunit